MAFTVKDLELVVDAVARGGNQIQLNAVAKPNSKLLTALGPLTDKLTKETTIGTAVALNYVLMATDKDIGLVTRQMRLDLNAVAQSVAVGRTSLSANYADAVEKFRLRFSSQTAFDSYASIKNDFKEQQNTPMWAAVLDFTLAAGLSMVPVAGPVLANLNQGLGKVISSAFTTGGTAISGNTSASWAAPLGGVIGAQFGTSKETIGTLLASRIANYNDKKKEKKLAALNGSALATFNQTFQKVINPITQDQVLNNTIFDKTMRLGVQSSIVVGSAMQLSQILEKSDATVDGYIGKFANSLNQTGDLIVSVVKASTVDSFEDIILKFETKSQQVAGRFAGRTSGTYVGEDDAKREKIVALLVTAYYLNVGLKSLRQDSYNHFQILFENMDVGDLVDPRLFRSSKFEALGKPKTLDAVKSNSDVVDFRKQRTLFKEAFKDSHDPLSRTKGQADINAPFSAAANAAERYLSIVRNAMLDTMSAVLFAHNNTEHLKEIMSLFVACSVIVNTVWKASISGKGEKIDFPKKAVDTIQAAGFLTYYTTTIGTVSKEEKLKLMNAEIVQLQLNGRTISKTLVFKNPETSTLRYYKGTFKGASDREKVMLYVFARAVTSQVNLYNYFIGVESWEAGKKSMHLTIAEINTVFHDLDDGDLVVKKPVGNAQRRP